jgi:predicted nucleic acid-binding protein
MILLDTSAAVALVVADHSGHDAVSRRVGRRRLGLAGHAWFETMSVLTRLPGAARRPVTEVHRLLEHDFPETEFLGAREARRLADLLPNLGIAGGSVYDALVGYAAAVHGRPLLTRDRRALDTYRALDVELIVIDE